MILQQVIVTPGLVARYSMEEQQGSQITDTANLYNLHGQIQNAMPLTSMLGVYNQTLSFNGKRLR